MKVIHFFIYFFFILIHFLLQRRMQEQLAQTMMQVQDNIAVRKVNYDSEEEDPMPFDCV